jgi:hypothetical protein
MDTPVSYSRFRRIGCTPRWDRELINYAITEIEGFEEEHHQLPFVENVPPDCRAEEEEVKGAQDAAEDVKLLYIRMRGAGGVQARFRKSLRREILVYWEPLL